MNEKKRPFDCFWRAIRDMHRFLPFLLWGKLFTSIAEGVLQVWQPVLTAEVFQLAAELDSGNMAVFKGKIIFLCICITFPAVCTMLLRAVGLYGEGKKESCYGWNMYGYARGFKLEALEEAKGQAVVPGTIERAAAVKKIVFACDAGMGSSAMGATKFRNRIKENRPDITVTNTSVDNIPDDCDIAVVQTTLAARARKSAPGAQLITIGNFLADPALDALYVQLTTGDEPAPPAGENTDIVIPDVPIKKTVLIRDGIKLGQKPVSKEEAIQAAGELLEKLGYVDGTYVDAMQEREKLVTTYMGMGVAIPHGTTQAKNTVKKSGIVFLQYPDGVDFGEEKAQLVFGIAGVGDEHLDLLANICTMLEDEARLETLKTTDDADWVLEQLS